MGLRFSQVKKFLKLDWNEINSSSIPAELEKYLAEYLEMKSV